MTPDAHLAATLNALRGLTFDGTAADTQHLVPGVFFSADPQGQVTVQASSRPGMLLNFRVQVDRPGRWLSLNMGVGSADLTDARIVSFACKADARATTAFRVCLRSGTEGGFRDVLFAKPVICGPDTAVHMDVLSLATTPEVPRQAPWRELVIFLDRDPQDVTLHDFRLTIL